MSIRVTFNSHTHQTETMGVPLKRTLTKLFRFAIVGVVLAIALQTYLRQRQEYFYSGNDIVKHIPTENRHETFQEPEENSNATLWQLMLQDPTITEFVKLNTPFGDINGPLDDPSQIWTLYVPIDSAYKDALHPTDAPPFYWKFLSLNHFGSGAVSYDDMLASTTTTVESRIPHDIFFNYRQRISVKNQKGEIAFNHVGKYVGKQLKAVNGYVHHISTTLYLPDSTSEVIRDNPSFETFRRGLIFTNVGVKVNDTQRHTSQTIFAPSNIAFKKLGLKANKFLFSPWGKPYLAALLRNHVVENRTLFTDMYLQAKGAGKIGLNTTSEPIRLPTMNSGVDLETSIVLNENRQSIRLNDKTVASDPDIITMDGVIHKIDELLLPPSLGDYLDGVGHGIDLDHRSSGSAWYNFRWPWNAPSSEISVDELMERLQPLVEKGEVS
ncbi:fasciclin domain family protein [Clohesyomyces aquaticus]|uniref:Fasciclin domain family protein n=1 Tax=Clohesyomyces aquaticus TaxID=1231657 RepID=A0A1Y1ZJU3_9PLEO|nr:fasciclin domain family protein [Clohesyomyces aquaticus]